MEKSESIAKLAEALAKAQSIMESAVKDASNPFYKSRYSTLASVWDACRKPLTDNGLSVIQTSVFSETHPEMVIIETILAHSSGEWIKSIMAAKPVKNDPQAIGSCVSYLRRYSLALVGVCSEDDDGNAASGKDQFCKPTPPVQRFEGQKISSKEDVKDFVPPTPPSQTAGNVESQKANIDALKNKLSLKMSGMSVAEKKDFFKYYVSEEPTEEKLTKFIDNYDYIFAEYLKSKG